MLLWEEGDDQRRRHKIWVLVTVVRYKDFLSIRQGSVWQKERLIRKQLLPTEALPNPVVVDHR